MFIEQEVTSISLQAAASSWEGLQQNGEHVFTNKSQMIGLVYPRKKVHVARALNDPRILRLRLGAQQAAFDWIDKDQHRKALFASGSFDKGDDTVAPAIIGLSEGVFTVHAPLTTQDGRANLQHSARPPSSRQQLGLDTTVTAAASNLFYHSGSYAGRNLNTYVSSHNSHT